MQFKEGKIIKKSLKRVKKDDYIEYYYTSYIQPPIKTTTKDKEGEKAISDLARAKRNIIEILELNLVPLSTFLTLTYKENQQDYEQAYKDFDKFIKKIKYHYIKDLKYIRVVELQKRGAIHFHVVIFNTEFRHIPYNDLYKLWGHGAIHVKIIDEFDVTTSNKLGNYLGNYLSKNDNIALNKRIYSISRNLKRLKREKIDISTPTKRYNKLKKLRDSSNIHIIGKDFEKFIKKA